LTTKIIIIMMKQIEYTLGLNPLVLKSQNHSKYHQTSKLPLHGYDFEEIKHTFQAMGLRTRMVQLQDLLAR
jgi:hypothetical protein